MMTYRERRLAKADRLREWADKRETKAETTGKAAHDLADMIPMGQPILVGHHSEGRHRRDLGRIESNTRKSIEHADKARDFRRRADGIEAAADHAVYSDDHDATEKLSARIAEREAQRDRWKTANKTAKREGLDTVAAWSEGLTETDRATAASCIKFWPGGAKVPFPDMTNLSASIRRDKKRLEGFTE